MRLDNPQGTQAIMKQAPAEIYGLFDPSDMSLRYIGKAQNSTKRFKDHMREMRRNTPLYSWIAKLRTAGAVPLMKVICVAVSADWQELERQMIAQGRADGVRLLNIADGGDEPFCSAKTRARNGATLVARLVSDPVLLKIQRNKRALNSGIRHGTLSEWAKKTMRLCAMKRPDLFGEWASL